MGIIKTLFCCTLFFLSSTSQLYGQEEVPWQEGKHLRWKNFKGKVLIGASAAATTASGISYEFSTHYKGSKMFIDYKVHAFFYPTKSWYKPKICNEVTLAHEQLHFDISELFARKMDKEMSKSEFTKNVKQEVRTIYKRILRELNDFQNKYDSETDFSRNIPQQKVWTLKIKKAFSQ